MKLDLKSEITFTMTHSTMILQASKQGCTHFISKDAVLLHAYDRLRVKRKETDDVDCNMINEI